MFSGEEFLKKMEDLLIKDIEDLKEFEKEVDDKYKIDGSPKVQPKKCYEEAYWYISKFDSKNELKLVHGLYKPEGIPFAMGHAWVELPDGTIFDGVLQRFYQKEAYFDYYNAIEEFIYSRIEMLDVASKAMTYGPWEFKFGR